MFSQFCFLLFALPFGQAIPAGDKRTDISCCALGTEFTTAVDTCQYWDQCQGGYTTCITTSLEQSICSQCLDNPTHSYCDGPITQSKKARDLEDSNVIFDSAPKVSKRDIDSEDLNFGGNEFKQLSRRLSEHFPWRLPNNKAFSTSVTLAGVVFNFIVNQAGEIYISMINDNGFPVIATIQDQITGWNEREPLPISGTASYQQVNGQPGDLFSFTVKT